jgi:hypothetical protein
MLKARGAGAARASRTGTNNFGGVFSWAGQELANLSSYCGFSAPNREYKINIYVFSVDREKMVDSYKTSHAV